MATNKGADAKPRHLVTETLHIMEMSSNFVMSNSHFEADLNRALSRNPDILGITEVRTPDRIASMRQIGPANGYVVVHQPQVNESFLVKVGDNIHVKGKGAIKITDGNGLPASNPASIPRRYVSWAHLHFHGLDLFPHICHWQAHTDEVQAVVRPYLEEMHVMCAQVRLHAKGNAMSFFMGDLNYDENDRDRLLGPNSPNVIFREQNMQLVYDELGVTPTPTLEGRAIDIIGKYKPDDRVTAKRYKVWEKGFSDHRSLSAWYGIEVREAKQTKDAETKTKPVKIFAQAGDRDFRDYLDQTIYPLPYAVDDSDTFNG
jgi:hypothetical protein